MPWPLPLLAQVPPASQIDLLTQQIEFLQDANSRMADSFGQFVTLVNVAITLVVAFIGILGFSTRREIKQSLDGLVRAEVKKQLANTVKAQVEDLERIILREAVVGQTQVDYLLPISPSPTPTAEYQLLKARGFQMAGRPSSPTSANGCNTSRCRPFWSSMCGGKAKPSPISPRRCTTSPSTAGAPS